MGMECIFSNAAISIACFCARVRRPPEAMLQSRISFFCRLRVAHLCTCLPSAPTLSFPTSVA